LSPLPLLSSLISTALAATRAAAVALTSVFLAASAAFDFSAAKRANGPELIA